MLTFLWFFLLVVVWVLGSFPVATNLDTTDFQGWLRWVAIGFWPILVAIGLYAVATNKA